MRGARSRVEKSSRDSSLSIAKKEAMIQVARIRIILTRLAYYMTFPNRDLSKSGTGLRSSTTAKESMMKKVSRKHGQKSISVLIAAVTTLLVLGVNLRISVNSNVTNADTTNADFYVPETISEEAQDILKSFSRERLDEREQILPISPNDLEGWKRFRQSVEERLLEINNEIVDRYQPNLNRTTLGGVPVIDIKPKRWTNNGKVLIYIHGGAYTLMSAQSTYISSVPTAEITGLRVISIDYTVAPVAQYEEITDQVIKVIQALIEEGYSLDDIALYGESSGGALAAGATLKMRDRGLGMPAALVLWSPWADITETGDTYQTLKYAEPAYRYETGLKSSADAYAALEDQKHPYVSPVYGDYTKGFPPTLIQGGIKEIFLSNFIRLYQALDIAAQIVKLDLYEGMWHAFQAKYPDLPESQIALEKMNLFLKEHLKKQL